MPVSRKKHWFLWLAVAAVAIVIFFPFLKVAYYFLKAYLTGFIGALS